MTCAGAGRAARSRGARSRRAPRASAGRAPSAGAAEASERVRDLRTVRAAAATATDQPTQPSWAAERRRGAPGRSRRDRRRQDVDVRAHARRGSSQSSLLHQCSDLLHVPVSTSSSVDFTRYVGNMADTRSRVGRGPPPAAAPRSRRRSASPAPRPARRACCGRCRAGHRSLRAGPRLGRHDGRWEMGGDRVASTMSGRHGAIGGRVWRLLRRVERRSRGGDRRSLFMDTMGNGSATGHCASNT